MTKQTLGEYRVGTEFNPSKNGMVDQIKQKSAELIDLISQIEEGEDFAPGRQRLKAIAMTEIEAGAMWAVKAATKPLPKT